MKFLSLIIVFFLISGGETLAWFEPTKPGSIDFPLEDWYEPDDLVFIKDFWIKDKWLWRKASKQIIEWLWNLITNCEKETGKEIYAFSWYRTFWEQNYLFNLLYFKCNIVSL